MNLPFPNSIAPERHQVLDVEQARFLRKELRLPALFVYKHRVHNNFVIACWLPMHHGERRFIDLRLLLDLGAIDRKMVQGLKQWASGKNESLKDFKRKLLERDRDQVRREQDVDGEARDAKKYLARRFRQEGNPEYELDPGFKTNLRAVGA